MDKIAMNEFNRVRFINAWSQIKKIIKDKNLPHFQEGQTLIIITELPSELFSAMNGYFYETYYWEEKLMIKIHNEQFKAIKPNSEMFNEIHSYLCLDTG